MSHIVSIQTEVRDEAAVKSACRRLNLPTPCHGRFELFSSTENGLGIQLPKWRYPVVANLDSGKLKFDNYEGRWGDQKALDGFLQGYAVEKARIEARKKGYSIDERKLEDGSIRVTISIGADA